MGTEPPPLKEELQTIGHALRIPIMISFAAGCFGVLLFLWVSFGGSVPLKSNQYVLKVHFPEATTLAEAADVRISGVTVGKVHKMELAKPDGREEAVLYIEPQFAPLAKDTRAILRQKTLLGETFVELTPGNKSSGVMKDGSTLSNGQVEPTVQLDEILRIFDPQTKKAFQNWVRSSAQQIGGTGGQDLNDALGNLAGFAQDGAGLLQVLDQQQTAVSDVVKNTGVVFRALGERDHQLASLIQTSNNTFATTAREQAALADTFRIFPTFLDQSRFTLARLETFSRNTDPLARDLVPVGHALSPTIRDLSALAPDLRTLFVRLKPVIKAAPRDLPQGARLLRGARPVFDGLHVFLPELNPILGFLNYDQNIVAHFLTNAPQAMFRRIAGDPTSHVLPQYGITNGNSLQLQQTVPNWVRANAYIRANALDRAIPLGVIESFSCANNGGTQRFPDTNKNTLPCYTAPPFEVTNTQFPFLQRGQTYTKPSPSNTLAGKTPADALKHP